MLGVYYTHKRERELELINGSDLKPFFFFFLTISQQYTLGCPLLECMRKKRIHTRDPKFCEKGLVAWLLFIETLFCTPGEISQRNMSLVHHFIKNC